MPEPARSRADEESSAAEERVIADDERSSGEERATEADRVHYDIEEPLRDESNDHKRAAEDADTRAAGHDRAAARLPDLTPEQSQRASDAVERHLEDEDRRRRQDDED